MQNNNMTTERLTEISSTETAENEQHYTERPLYQRVLAWVLFGIIVVGIGLYCYWLMVPQA